MDDVIGAGIGGLTLGIALHRAGIRCRIFESVAGGDGLQLVNWVA